jgi:hypothetical protein
MFTTFTSLRNLLAPKGLASELQEGATFTDAHHVHRTLGMLPPPAWSRSCALSARTCWSA